MTKTTKATMAKFRRKLTRFEGLTLTACGHDELVQKAIDCRFDLEYFIESELERLARKAGEA